MRERSSEDLKEKESDNEREGERDQVIERERGYQRDHVEEEGRSMSRGRDETEQQKRGDKRAGGKNVYRERKSRGENEQSEETVRGKAACEVMSGLIN